MEIVNGGRENLEACGPVEHAVRSVKAALDTPNLRILGRNPSTATVVLEVGRILGKALDVAMATAVPWPRLPNAGVVDLVDLKEFAVAQGPTDDTIRIVFRFGQGPPLLVAFPKSNLENIVDMLRTVQSEQAVPTPPPPSDTAGESLSMADSDVSRDLPPAGEEIA